MTKKDFERFFSAAHQGLAAEGRLRMTARFGHQTIAIHCASDELWARLEPAIGHWEDPQANKDAAPDFTICAGSNDGLPAPLQAPDWQHAQFTEAGVPLTAKGEPIDFDLRFQPWQRVIHAHKDGVGLFWVASPEELPWWEATFPFRILLHWWSRGTSFQLMHAAAVSPNGRTSYLIPGPSGSGKSTTVVSLLQAGCASQGDDYVLVELGDSPRVFPLYNSIKLTWEAVDRFFPQLRSQLRLPVPEAKAVAPLSTLGAFAPAMPLAGVLVPALPADPTPPLTFEPINPAEALLAIAPTTLHHLPEGRQESWSKMTELLRALPVQKWHLSPDLRRNVLRFPMAQVAQTERVAVVMPAFNPGPEIQRAWASIRDQDWTRASVQLLLIDDASTDAEAVSRMRALASAHPNHVRLQRLPANAGPAAARNAGLATARSLGADWVAFCDHDDEWPENKWLIQFGHALTHPQLEVVGGWVQYHVAEGVDDPIDRYLDEDKHVSHVHLGAIIARSKVFETVGGFDEGLRFSEDFDWWNRVREAGVAFEVLPTTTLRYHYHGGNSVHGKSASSLGVLDILHRSLERRREKAKGGAPAPLPSLRDVQQSRAYDVVVPVHNGLAFLPELLACLAAQTLPAASVIFVNDASTDGSGEWLDAHVHEILGDAGQTHHLPQNLGVAGARNVGWRLGLNPWVAFLDQDDRWHPEKMERQLANLASSSGSQWGTVWCRPLLDDGFVWPSNWAPSMQVPHKCDVPSGWVISRVALHGLGGFNEAFRYGDDTEIAGRLRDRFGTGHVVEEVLVDRRFGPHNNSHKMEEMKSEMMQILKARIAAKQRGEITSRKVVYVVVAVFNASRYLDDVLRSIEAQTHRDWVGCLVNDGSTDDSLAILRRHAQRDLRWQVIDQPNAGAPSAVNAALARMPDDAFAVAFCDSDDLWLPTKLAAQLAAAQEAFAADAFAAEWCIGTLVEEFEDFPADVAQTHRARTGAQRAILRSNALISKALVEALGQMDPDQRFADFIEWIAPAIRKGVSIQYVPEVLVRRRIHGANMTAAVQHSAYLETLRRHIHAKRGRK